MPKARIALIAAVLLALGCMLFAILTAGPSSASALHYLRVEQVSGAMVVSFAIGKNYVASIIPIRLEKLDGTNWISCSQGLGGFSQTDPDKGNMKLFCI